MTNRYEIATKVDTAIAKALHISEVAQIARTEARMVKFFLHEWLLLAEKAADLADRKARSGSNSEEVIASVDRIMKRWSKLVRKIYVQETRRVYAMARIAGHKKATRRITSSLQYSEAESQMIVSKASPLPDTEPEPDMGDGSDFEVER